MQNLLAQLTSSGLTNNEAQIYLTLLQLKKATAYKISKESGVKKPTTYLTLEELRERGMVLKTPQKRGSIYQAKPPIDFVKTVEEKLQSITSVLPQLNKLFGNASAGIDVYFYEGAKGFRDVLLYKIKELSGKNISGFYSQPPENIKEIANIINEFGESLAQNNISIFGIAPKHNYSLPSDETNQKLYKNMKFVDKETYSSNISIDTGLSFLRIVDYRNMNGVIIENKEVSRAFLQIFSMVYGTL